MKFLVTTEVFETIHKEEDLRRQVELIKTQLNNYEFRKIPNWRTIS